jgi:hypothetical protein
VLYTIPSGNRVYEQYLRLQVCTAGGVKLAMSALLQHTEDAPIIVSACGLLRQLAKNDDIKKLFVSRDGYDAAEKILKGHKQSPKVCSQV